MPQCREGLAQRSHGGNLAKDRELGVKAVISGCAEGPKARQAAIILGSEARSPRKVRVLRPKHGLPQIAVRLLPVRQPFPLRILRPGKGLLRAVVDAGNAQGEKLQGYAGSNLGLRCSLCREADLLPEDMIVIVQDGNMLITKVAVRSEDYIGVKALEVCSPDESALWPRRPRPAASLRYRELH